MGCDIRGHHRRSIRLEGWDYSQPGAYFVTICTCGWERLFGWVVDGKMMLSPTGEIAHNIWMEIPLHFHNVILDEMIVMPNHIHGIIMITNVGAGHALPLRQNRRFGKVPSQSLHSIIGSYKSAVTKRINEIRKTPGAALWQRNYYEHIVRNETELNRIREYIQTNPLRWHLDRENPQRGGTDEFDRWLKECVISRRMNNDERRNTKAYQAT